MVASLVDTNVLLDIVTNDAVWADWSISQLDAALLKGPVVINEVVYAELSVRFTTIEALEGILAQANVSVAPTPRAALFLAAKVFQRYRAAGGARTGVLPDFFVGAHAGVSNLPLLTRDARRYRTYFPTLDLIAP
jgi:predicted nucleic acid-binding protein